MQKLVHSGQMSTICPHKLKFVDKSKENLYISIKILCEQIKKSYKMSAF